MSKTLTGPIIADRLSFFEDRNSFCNGRPPTAAAEAMQFSADTEEGNERNKLFQIGLRIAHADAISFSNRRRAAGAAPVREE